MSRILMIVTNHSLIDGEPMTGIWLSEFAEPFAAFIAAGHVVTVASPLGGPAPVDPRGYPGRDTIAAVRDALERLNATRPVARQRVENFDGVFVPGGHGPMFDLATDREAKVLIGAFWDAGKPVAAVCHGPAALLDVPVAGGTLIKGRRVTGFSKGEDAVDALFAHMPFSLEDRMRAEGAAFIEYAPHAPHVEVDGRLVTGQNPASGAPTAEAFLKVLYE
jgi:putative intracellular protease/amidase